MFIFVLYDSQRKDLYNIGLIANPNPNFDIDNKKLKVKYVLLINDQKDLFKLYADSLKQYKKNDTNYEIPERSVILQNMESLLIKSEYNTVRKNLRTDKDFFIVAGTTQKQPEQKRIFGLLPKFFNLQISEPKPEPQQSIAIEPAPEPAQKQEPETVPVQESVSAPVPIVTSDLDDVETEFEIVGIEQDQKNGESVPMENPVTLEPKSVLIPASVPEPVNNRKLELYRFLVQENPVKKEEPVKKKENQEPDPVETTPKIQHPEIRESHLDL